METLGALNLTLEFVVCWDVSSLRLCIVIAPYALHLISLRIVRVSSLDVRVQFFLKKNVAEVL